MSWPPKGWMIPALVCAGLVLMFLASLLHVVDVNEYTAIREGRPVLEIALRNFAGSLSAVAGLGAFLVFGGSAMLTGFWIAWIINGRKW